MYHGRSGSIPESLNAVNRLLAADASNGKFMTLGVVRFTPGGISAASAGHDDAEILGADGKSFRTLGGRDIPLAVDEAWEYSETTAPPLEAGELLVLASDGVWEARNRDGEQYGKERLREVMRQHRQRPAAQIVEAVRYDVKAFRRGAPTTDDVMIIAVKA